MARVSKAMRRALENGVAGRALDHGIFGQSQSGGFDQTWKVLRRRGWIDANGNVTEAGAEAIGVKTDADAIRTPDGGFVLNH